MARALKVRAQVLRELAAIARSGRPVIAGPWLGEVGFEILYWIPFLRWAAERVRLDPARIVAVSRGGPAGWYADVASRYVEVFDLLSIEAYRDGNERRKREAGEQKQVRPSTFDEAIASLVRIQAGLGDAVTLHPSLMYRICQPYWWKHAGTGWVARHARYRRMPAPALPAGLRVEAGRYVAVKFYFNDCLTDAPATRDRIASTIDRLAEHGAVVSLGIGLVLDDHLGAECGPGGGVKIITPLVGPRNNLDVQSAVVANARAFVGTYGGFSYLAPLYGVPSAGVYANPDGFDPAHLQMAQAAFRAIGSAPMRVIDVAGPIELAGVAT